MNSPATVHSASWTQLRVEGAALWTQIYTTPDRLTATLTLIQQYQEHGDNLRPLLGGIMALLESSREVAALNPIAIQVLIGLDHWLIALDEWPRWERLLRHYQKQATAMGDHEAEAILRMHLSSIVWQMGRSQEARALALRAFEGEVHRLSASSLGQITRQVVWLTLQFHDWETAARTLQRVKELADARPPHEQILLNGFLAMLWADYERRNGHLAEAVSRARESVSCFAQTPLLHRPTQASAWRVCGVYEWAFGDYAAALNSLRTAAELYRAIGDDFGRAWALANQGLVYRNMGRVSDAEQKTRQSLAIFKRYDAHWQMTFEIGNLALIDLMAGRLKNARRLMKRQAHLADQYSVDDEIIRARTNTALIDIPEQRYRQALRTLHAVYPHYRKHKRQEGLAVIHAAFCQCYAGLNRPEQAQKHGRRALHISQSLQSRRIEMISRRALAEALPAQEAVQMLHKTMALAVHDPYERIACEVSLLTFETDAAERQERWEGLRERLIEMDLGAWVFGCDSDHLPRLLVIT